MKRILFGLALAAALSVGLLAQSNTSTTQMQLVSSSTFTNRLQYLMTQQAVVVLTEVHATACHTQRAAFAMQVIQNPASSASAASVLLAGSTNVVGTVVTDGNGQADSSASDAALLSQIATDWNVLSRCDTGS